MNNSGIYAKNKNSDVFGHNLKFCHLRGKYPQEQGKWKIQIVELI